MCLIMNLDDFSEPFSYSKLVKFETNNNVSSNISVYDTLYTKDQIAAHLRVWKAFIRYNEIAYAIINAANGQQVYVTVTLGSIVYSDKMTNEFLVRVMSS